MHESEAMALIEPVLSAFFEKYFRYFEDSNFDKKSYDGYLKFFAKTLRSETAYETEEKAKRTISVILSQDMKYARMGEEDLKIEFEGTPFSRELDEMLDWIKSRREVKIRQPFGEPSEFFRNA